MNESSHRLQTIFGEAIEISELSAREEYLDSACGTDLTLRQEIAELLAAEAQAGQFLPSCPATSAARAAIKGTAEVLGPQGDLVECLAREKPGDRIGRYRLLKKLGEGGCGVVYLAEQEAPVRRRVALKVIKLGMDTRQVVARFEAERQALALMDHPNIAKVFDAGATEAGRPFFVMELAEGIRITDYCNRKSLGMRQRLELFIQVCQAVQHAHQKGVIHRDLKPSNILVAARDGVAVPKVIDFGIAKATEGRLTGLTLLTAFEQFLGTPAYMSPEQAALTDRDVDTRSDIYSLGVLLYELLTGATPFDTKALLAAGLDELRRTIREKEPLRPSTRLADQLESGDVADVRNQVPSQGRPKPDFEPLARRPSETKEIIKLVRGDLDWIVMKCLEKDRTRRYETANGLASDIQRHLNNEPVMARPPSRLYEFQKTVRRHQVGFAAAAAVIVSLVAGVLVSVWQAVQKENERQLFQNSLVRQYVANGSRLMNEGDLFGSLLWYVAALSLDRGDAQREQPHRIRIASVLRQCPKLLGVLSHGTIVYDVKFSPDGTKVLTCGVDHTARVWDSESGDELFVLHHDGEVNDARFSPDGLRIITASGDRTARVWDSQNGTLLRTLKHESIVWNACFGPGDHLIATACDTNKAQLWDSRTGETIGSPFVSEWRIEKLEFSPDGRTLAANGSNQVCLWDVATGQKRLLTNYYSVFSMESFSPDSQWLLTHQGTAIHVWSLKTLKEAAYSPLHASGEINSLAFSPDGQSIVSGAGDSSIGIWDVTTGQSRLSHPFRHQGTIEVARLSPDGRCLATGAVDERLQLWSTHNGEPVAPPINHSSGVTFFGFNPDGHRFVANSCDRGAPRLWDLANSDLPGPARPKIPSEHRIVSPDGKLLLARESNTVWIVRTETGDKLTALRHTNDLLFASFSGDGRSVITSCVEAHATSHHKNHILLWDSTSGRQINSQDMAHPFGLIYVAFSCDTLLTCGGDSTAQLWDAHNCGRLGPPMRHVNDISWAAFNSNGSNIVTASGETARVWDAATCQPLTPPLQHRALVVGAFWSVDGKRLHTVTQDDYLQVWDLATGEPLTPPRKIRPEENQMPASRLLSSTNADESLPLDARPVADLVLLSQLLDLARIDANGKVLPLQVADVLPAWLSLRQKYPEQFAATPAEVAAWHRNEARQCLADGNAAAAQLHLDRAWKDSPQAPTNELERAPITAVSLGANPPLARPEGSTRFPPRDPSAGPDQIDLSRHYNLELQRPGGNDLHGLRPGLLTLSGVSFDVRGIVHLNGKMAKQEGATYPECVTNIAIGRKCRWLHFLQAVEWDAFAETNVGVYILHYMDGEQRTLPIQFGRDLSCWWFDQATPPLGGPNEATPVWTGYNPKAASYGNRIVLYDSVRGNPRPDVALASIDFLSTMSPAAPFLVALTLGSTPERPILKPATGARTDGALDDLIPPRFPRRDPKTGPSQIDLSQYYNSPLHQAGAGDFGDLCAGLQTLGGVLFDVRGVVYVSCETFKQQGSNLPERLNNIRVERKCHRLHFLQGTGMDYQDGRQVGSYVLHYADGQQRELPIIDGRDTGSWWMQELPTAPKEPGAAYPVWSGQNRANAKDHNYLYLYKSTRQNPRPDVELVSIDLVSSMTLAAPFLVALTVE